MNSHLQIYYLSHSMSETHQVCVKTLGKYIAFQISLDSQTKNLIIPKKHLVLLQNTSI